MWICHICFLFCVVYTFVQYVIDPYAGLRRVLKKEPIELICWKPCVKSDKREFGTLFDSFSSSIHVLTISNDYEQQHGSSVSYSYIPQTEWVHLL